MTIHFARRSLERALMSEHELRRRFGVISERLMLRLLVLAHAGTLADVPTGPPERCHRLSGREKGLFAVSVSGNVRILFRPVLDAPLEPDHGEMDLAQIKAITIVDIVDYH